MANAWLSLFALGSDDMCIRCTSLSLNASECCLKMIVDLFRHCCRLAVYAARETQQLLCTEGPRREIKHAHRLRDPQKHAAESLSALRRPSSVASACSGAATLSSHQLAHTRQHRHVGTITHRKTLPARIAINRCEPSAQSPRTQPLGNSAPSLGNMRTLEFILFCRELLHMSSIRQPIHVPLPR
jgi:hypothetical protein